MLDELWDRYAGRIIDLARRELGNDPAMVEAVCLDVALKLYREIAFADGTATDATWWSWLRDSTEASCHRIRDAGEIPTPTLAAQLLGSDLAIRERITRRPGAFGIAALVARRAERILDGIVRSARAGIRRAEAALAPSSASGGPSLNFLMAGGSGLSEAAAMVAAVVAVTFVSPGAAHAGGTQPREPINQVANRTSLTDARIDASRDGHLAEIDPTAIADPDHPARGSSAGSPPSPSLPIAPATASDGDDVPSPPVPVAPRVAADPEHAMSEPVRERPHDDGVQFSTPEERVTIDADDDGNDEASLGTPGVFVECGPPEERGPVMGATCPVLEPALAS